MNNNWSASLVFYECPVTIRVIIPGFSSENEAEKFYLSDRRLILRQTQSSPALVLIKNGSEYVIPRAQAEIKLDPPNMPRPLDVRDADDFQTILNSIDDPSSPYHIKEEDMMEVNWSYKELAEAIGYVDSFSCLACGAFLNDPSAAPLEPSSPALAQALASHPAAST